MRMPCELPILIMRIFMFQCPSYQITTLNGYNVITMSKWSSGLITWREMKGTHGRVVHGQRGLTG
jgi:hypothetical protein